MGYKDPEYDDEQDIDGTEYEQEDELVSKYKGEVSSSDAYTYSMRVLGRVDLSFMSKISEKTKEELVCDLIGVAIWPDPEVYDRTNDYFGCFTSGQQYCKGNLVKKYKKAIELNRKYGLFDTTVELLKKEMPDAVTPDEIHMNLGSTWIPIQYVKEFVMKLLDMLVYPKIDYSEFLGKWTVECVTLPDFVKNSSNYGTARMPAVTIIKHILNAKPVVVYDQIPRQDGKKGTESILNKAETVAAQQKEKLIQEAWQDFIHGDVRIENHLQEVYMENYGYGLSRYDGSFLELADLNSEIKPYEHQKNAIARIILNNNTLLAHEVGAGKSLEFMIGVHELIRLKLGKKALIVVPNNTFASVVSTYKELYKDEAILAVNPKKDFTPAKREETLAKMKSSQYKVIIMAYSSFDMITMSPDYKYKKLNKQLADCRMEIARCNNYATRRALQAEKKKLEKALDKMLFDGTEPSNTACFDELSVDILVVDEAHNYKNISLDNNVMNIVGVHNAGSKKANNMLEKVEYIQSVEGHVIFATGTPITNSMADAYVLQRYLQPEELKLCKIYHFNDWINTFCSQKHTFEIDVDSKNFRYTTRFSEFHNIPELMMLFSNMSDFYQVKNGELGLPEFDGYSNDVVKKSEAQKMYINELAERTEFIRAHLVKRTEDNLLKITVDGKKCALDIRLVVPDAVVTNEDTKVKTCARNMAHIYREFPKTTQIAFSDISTPKDGFNMYDELKKELIAEGIPEYEIAFIHDADNDAKRSRIEKRFNAGEIRILIGSTMKLGTGSNVQERLIAIHHLDIPWRPADMVQREGRIIRQGNTNSKVFVYRYVTEASFDSYTYQILENKQRFISQFLAGSLSGVHRNESDCADTVLDYAEIKALAIGNPLIKERVETANELEHMKINQRQKRKEINTLKELLRGMPAKIKSRKNLIYNCQADRVFYESHKQSVSMDRRESLGEIILGRVSKNVMNEKDRVITAYQGFDVVLPAYMRADKPYVVLRRYHSNSYSIKMDTEKPLGVSKRFDYVLDNLDRTTKFHEDALADLYKQQQNAAKSIVAGNEFDEQVEVLSERLNEIDRILKEDNEI